MPLEHSGMGGMIWTPDSSWNQPQRDSAALQQSFLMLRVWLPARCMGQDDLGCWKKWCLLGVKGTPVSESPGTWLLLNWRSRHLNPRVRVRKSLNYKYSTSPKKSVKHSFPTMPCLSLLLIFSTAVINKINKHIREVDGPCNKIVTKNLNYFAHNLCLFQGTLPYSWYWDEREPSRDCTFITYFSIKNWLKFAFQVHLCSRLKKNLLIWKSFLSPASGTISSMK